jgi:hypothetical protein
MYDFNPDQVGEEFTCRDCGAVLVVEPKALRIVRSGSGQPASHPAPSEPVGPVSRPVTTRSTRHNPDDNAPRGSASNILATVFLGVGAVLAILFTLLPFVDQARVSSLYAPIKDGENRLQRELDELDEDLAKDAGKGGKPLDLKALEALNKKREKIGKQKEEKRTKWNKEKKKLEAKREDAQVWNLGAYYLYSWGQLIGYILVAVGALGYLGRGTTTSRRVIGGIVFSVLVLYLFITLTGGIARFLSMLTEMMQSSRGRR